ncbi:thioredoxin TrxA [Buchnera aphidicola (Pemphigus obesinymphae)]|uniref:thioredoxin TrxA n=1 Tax=Buchnera aphidicola TaxID=9 RepID=UPI0022381368|nr:thioredoxin TrxA [Buchnera aphidicola]MCW5196892.1 thioredoxin TrxA [Buchnera aphidicola (Pemphigus obesinymphae)]
MNNTKIVNFNDENFEKNILQEKKFILVDFWAEWCNPCKMLAPILEEIAVEYQDQLIVAKINIDENPDTAPKYSIRGIPALLLFKNGKLIKTKIGALSKIQLQTFLNKYLI